MIRFLQIACCFFLLLTACAQQNNEPGQQYLVVLGIAQDAGFPQLHCNNENCKRVHNGLEAPQYVSSLGLIDKAENKSFLFDATPDITEQLDYLNKAHLYRPNIVDGVFLTHAHIGHYTGLMYFGREVVGAKEIPVYAMPKMATFLTNNGPWSQLVSLQNITLKQMQQEVEINATKNLSVTPILVPHRDEFSETVGYIVKGPKKSALFVPDINKWHLWEKSIINQVKQVDYAFLDATFYKDGELSRPMSEVPHPFIEETMALFKNESATTKAKIYFIHFNHSNPAVLKSHPLKQQILDNGFNCAEFGAEFYLD